MLDTSRPSHVIAQTTNPPYPTIAGRLPLTTAAAKVEIRQTWAWAKTERGATVALSNLPPPDLCLTAVAIG